MTALPLWAYYNRVGTEEQVFDVAARMAESSTAPIQLLCYAHALSRRQKFAEALQVLDRRMRREMDGDCFRIYIMAELHPDNLDALCASMKELIERYGSRNAEYNFPLETCRRIYLLLGMKNEAAGIFPEVKRQLSFDINEPGLARAYFSYVGGSNIDEDLSIQGKRWEMFLYRYLVGLTHLADGDRACS